MKFEIQTGDYLQDSFLPSIEDVRGGIFNCVINYRIKPKLALPKENFYTELFIYCSWKLDDVGMPPSYAPDKVMFTLNPISYVKSIGKAFVRTFSNYPPEYSAFIVQRILVQAIDGIPEFEIRCAFELSPNEISLGQNVLHGFLAFHCGTTSYMLTRT